MTKMNIKIKIEIREIQKTQNSNQKTNEYFEFIQKNLIILFKFDETNLLNISNTNDILLSINQTFLFDSELTKKMETLNEFIYLPSDPKCYCLNDLNSIFCFLTMKFNNQYKEELSKEKLDISFSITGDDNSFKIEWSTAKPTLKTTKDIYWDPKIGRAAFEYQPQNGDTILYLVYDPSYLSSNHLKKYPNYPLDIQDSVDLEKAFAEKNINYIQDFAQKNIQQKILLQLEDFNPKFIKSFKYQSEVFPNQMVGILKAGCIQNLPQEEVLNQEEGLIDNNCFYVYIKQDLSPKHQMHVFLHQIAHILLGHIQINDIYAHWDTMDSIFNANIMKNWDKEVRDYFLLWFKRDYNDLSNKEKAMFALLHLMEDLTNTHHVTLDTNAERYQKTNYQKQAAKRLIDMLENLDGAMLCDGVGLGKTYVATTVIVHLYNHFIKNSSDLANNPYRVTVLVPHAVKSTWETEAIPPLSNYGVLTNHVRVLSHHMLSSISSSSALLNPKLQSTDQETLSDLEHLIFSDLVIIDEAHNFRSRGVKRSKNLVNLLRIKPRERTNRKVLLLTATPINNSMDDFLQQLLLIFSESLQWKSHKKTSNKQFVKTQIEDIKKSNKKNVLDDLFSNIVKLENNTDNFKIKVLNQMQSKSSQLSGFRTLKEYLDSEQKKFDEMKNKIAANEKLETSQLNVASELLNEVVVQRSRKLCQEIEEISNSNVKLLFRKELDKPINLRYADDSEKSKKIVENLLDLFQGDHDLNYENQNLSEKGLFLKIYMWSDLKKGTKTIQESSSVVGLQRILLLKRLESSPVVCLLTLLRLFALHAKRIDQLLNFYTEDEKKILKNELSNILACLSDQDIERLIKLSLSLISKQIIRDRTDLITQLAQLYRLKTDDIETTQTINMNEEHDDDDNDDDEDENEEHHDDENNTHINELKKIKEFLFHDFELLVNVIPGLIHNIFESLEIKDYPTINWKKNKTSWSSNDHKWAMLIINDSKVKVLTKKLVTEFKLSKKIIIFSQFSETISYLYSIYQAFKKWFSNIPKNELLTNKDIQEIKASLEISDINDLKNIIDYMEHLVGGNKNAVSIVDRFAPFYRISPFEPNHASEKEIWEKRWIEAIKQPIYILLASDILAEGVNLQDVHVLINFDIHWNPVKMIQRTGRIDRRLNERIEASSRFPHLEALCSHQTIQLEVPKYEWYGKNHPPQIYNFLLPDHLEEKLMLRQKISIKTIMIDMTLGLEQGTGAEADWMKNYKYNGNQSLNHYEQNRAIEKMFQHKEKIMKDLIYSGFMDGIKEIADLPEELKRVWFDLRKPTQDKSMIHKPTSQIEHVIDSKIITTIMVKENKHHIFSAKALIPFHKDNHVYLYKDLGNLLYKEIKLQNFTSIDSHIYDEDVIVHHLDTSTDNLATDELIRNHVTSNFSAENCNQLAEILQRLDHRDVVIKNTLECLEILILLVYCATGNRHTDPNVSITTELLTDFLDRTENRMILFQCEKD